MNPLRAVLFLCSCIVITGCGVSQNYQQAKPVAEKFLQDFKAQQYNQAYGLLSSESQAYVSNQALQNYLRNVEKKKGRVQSWIMIGWTAKSGGINSAHLVYKIQCVTGVTIAELDLSLRDKQWYVETVNFK